MPMPEHLIQRPHPSTAPRWPQQLWARWRSHLLFKTLALTLFLTVFFIAYFHLLRHPAHAVTMMPLTWLDHAISFQPWTLAFYASLWFYVAIPMHLIETRRHFIALGSVYFLLCLAGLICFYLWPTAIPRPDIQWHDYPGFGFLQSVDSAGNACPSLHVATAVFAGIWLERFLRALAAPRWTRLGNLLWCAAIVYSTIATRQHVVLDAAAGTLLGLLFGMLSAPLGRRLLPGTRG
jgi:PAP2 superfamily